MKINGTVVPSNMFEEVLSKTIEEIRLEKHKGNLEGKGRNIVELLSEKVFRQIGPQKPGRIGFYVEKVRWPYQEAESMLAALKSLGFSEIAVNATRNDSINILDATPFEESLQRWEDDPLVEGEKKLAAERIRKNYYGNIRGELNLEGLKLSQVPSAIGYCEDITHLMLEGNVLTELPEELSRIAGLKHLMLTKNKFSVFPRVICQMGALVDLSLAENSLTSLPPEMCGLKNLKMLWLQKNNLQSLPRELLSFETLGTVSVEKNPELKSISLSFVELSKYGYGSSFERTAIPRNILDRIGGFYNFASQYGRRYEDPRGESLVDAEIRCRYELFKAFANSPDWLDTSYLRQLFTEDEKKLLSIWLYRLARSAYLTDSEEKFADNVCKMVEALTGNSCWRETFFRMLSQNTEGSDPTKVLATFEEFFKVFEENLEDYPVG